MIEVQVIHPGMEEGHVHDHCYWNPSQGDMISYLCGELALEYVRCQYVCTTCTTWQKRITAGTIRWDVGHLIDLNFLKFMNFLYGM